jgi:CelD/BcsL family acetyltransferase involved in cellulose biosynthesis
MSNTRKNGYDITWLKSLAEIDAFATEWRALDSVSTAELVWFQSFEWCRHWVETHAGQDAKPRVLVLSREGKADVILPLQSKRLSRWVNVIEILGAPHSQYANILTRNGHLSAMELSLLREALIETSGAHAAVFEYVPKNSVLAQLFPGTASEELSNESAQFEFARLASGAAFESTLSKDRQRDMRRQMRLLEAQGPVTFEVLRPGMDGYSQAIDDCMVMKRQWLTETAKLGASIKQAGHTKFLAAMGWPAETNDGPYVWSMKVADRAVAIEVGFLQRGHYYAYMGAFDWNLRKASPGKLQMCMTINALAKLNATSYDLLANPTDYKKEYSTKCVGLIGHEMSLSKRGKVYVKIWNQFLRPALRRAFYRLPVDWRNGLMLMPRLDLSFGV